MLWGLALPLHNPNNLVNAAYRSPTFLFDRSNRSLAYLKSSQSILVNKMLLSSLVILSVETSAQRYPITSGFDLNNLTIILSTANPSRIFLFVRSLGDDAISLISTRTFCRNICRKAFMLILVEINYMSHGCIVC